MDGAEQVNQFDAAMHAATNCLRALSVVMFKTNRERIPQLQLLVLQPPQLDKFCSDMSRRLGTLARLAAKGMTAYTAEIEEAIVLAGAGRSPLVHYGNRRLLTYHNLAIEASSCTLLDLRISLVPFCFGDDGLDDVQLAEALGRLEGPGRVELWRAVIDGVTHGTTLDVESTKEGIRREWARVKNYMAIEH